ncbi:proline-rich protein 25-like [Cavia porcellus]|uniref:proline-rich protein 25-like n=1 Tax=Cavia porcellus TaxID=10141 RepID=UPI002FE28253
MSLRESWRPSHTEGQATPAGRPLPTRAETLHALRGPQEIGPSLRPLRPQHPAQAPAGSAGRCPRGLGRDGGTDLGKRRRSSPGRGPCGRPAPGSGFRCHLLGFLPSRPGGGAGEEPKAPCSGSDRKVFLQTQLSRDSASAPGGSRCGAAGSTAPFASPRGPRFCILRSSLLPCFGTVP